MDKGKKAMIAAIVVVIVVVGAVAAYYAYKPSGNTTGEITTMVVKVGDMKAKLSSGSVAGFIAWEPFCSDAVESGAGEVLLSSNDIWAGHPCCVIAADAAYASANAGSVARFLRAEIEANDWINAALPAASANHSKLVDIAVKFTGRSAATVEEALKGLQYKHDIDSALRADLRTFTDKLIEYNVTYSSKVTDRGYSDTADFVSKYVDSAHLDHAQNQSYNAGTATATVRVGYLTGDLHQLPYAVAGNGTLAGGMSFFAKHNISVVDPTSGAGYASGAVVMTKFAAAEIDIGYLGCSPAITAHLNSAVSVKIISQVNSEGSAIIVSSGIKSIKDLAGKNVAIPSTSSVQFFLLRMAAEKEGMTVK